MLFTNSIYRASKYAVIFTLQICFGISVALQRVIISSKSVFIGDIPVFISILNKSNYDKLRKSALEVCY